MLVIDQVFPTGSIGSAEKKDKKGGEKKGEKKEEKKKEGQSHFDDYLSTPSRNSAKPVERLCQLGTFRLTWELKWWLDLDM